MAFTWAEREATPLPWHIGYGSIVSERKPDGSYPDTEDMAYYGGHFVCESIGRKDAEFILLAILQRNALLSFFNDISDSGYFANEVRVIRDRMEELQALVEMDSLRSEVMKAYFSWAHYITRISRVPQLPEFASRARIESNGFPYWPSGRFVTDNVELEWQNKQPNCDSTGHFHDFYRDGYCNWRFRPSTHRWSDWIPQEAAANITEDDIPF